MLKTKVRFVYVLRICGEDYIIDIKVLIMLPINFTNIYLRTNKDLLPGICGNG